MRGRVHIEFGGRDHSLLPTYEVAEQFEARHGGIVDHYEKLNNGSAPMQVRAYLILLALKQGEGGDKFTLQGVMKAMFEFGLWHGDLVRKENELIEGLIYTPEQLLAKKEEEKAAMKIASEALGVFSE
ncbi:hypothetical protein AB9F29_19580 [Falsihalocynthiibacter sp. S25ZX9]|uniref:hypothetical protein n=1 Tax=unclassified Falsihalocynthiibacter TaxID=2854191 RepID=UPI00351007C1